MRPDSAIRIVVCLTLGLSAQAATITITGGGSGRLHDQDGSSTSWLERWSYLGGIFFEDPIDDGAFAGTAWFTLPPVEDVTGLRMDIYPLRRTISCLSTTTPGNCSAWGDSWLTSLVVGVEGPNGKWVNVPVSSSINLLALGPEFFPSSDQETSYFLVIRGAGYLSAPHPFVPLTEVGDFFWATMDNELPATLTATLVIPEPRYYAIAGGLLFGLCVRLTQR
jgi:hypothetical protein